MNINDIYVLVQYIVNKNQQGYVPPSKFNEVINQAQRSYISYLLGSFQSYLPGRPLSRVELGQNSVVRQRLSPVIKNTSLGIDMYGVSPYPTDYLQADAMRMPGTFQRVRFVQQDSLYSYYNSVIDPVGSNPIYLIEDTGFQFYPTSLEEAKLSYISNPPDMIWGYELVANRPVYSPEKNIEMGEMPTTDGWFSPDYQKYSHDPGYSDSLVFQGLDPFPLLGNYYEIEVTVINNDSLENVSFYFGGLTLLNVPGSVSGETYTIKGVLSTNTPFTIQPSINFDGDIIVNSINQTSVQPVWDDLSIFEIIQRALSMIGVNLQSAAISQFAEQIKREGQ
jgi:hypothetical protein